MKIAGNKIFFASVLVGAFFAVSAPAANKTPLGTAIETQDSTVQAAMASQRAIDKVADQSRQLLTEYNFTMQRYDALQSYNRQVQKLLDSQHQDLDAIKQQLIDVDLTHQGIVPLMADMVDALRQFVALDRPFLLDERQRRVAMLAAMLDKASVPVAEKYRRIVEALQIEVQYGHTLEAYPGLLDLAGEKRAVEFLRIGRLTLIYQTLDKQQAFIWRTGTGDWGLLSDEFAEAVTLGMRIARQQAAPDWMVLPVSAPERLR